MDSHPFSEGPWFCKHCNKPFSVYEDLIKHKRYMRNENKEDHIHCKLCGRDFHTLEGEMKHMQVVSHSEHGHDRISFDLGDRDDRSILLSKIWSVPAVVKDRSSAWVLSLTTSSEGSARALIQPYSMNFERRSSSFPDACRS
jgi:hypothetical protein